MTSDLLGISISGLRYSQRALSTTGHNIANAATQGYSRQTVNGVTNPASYIGVGYIGNGVAVESINRMVNDFVTQQLRTDSSLHQGLDVFHNQMGQLNGLLSDASTGLSGGLSSFFAALQSGADDPTSIPARQLIISEAENLADRFNTLHSRFDAFKAGVNKSMEAAVAQINSLTTNLAELNRKIADASGSGANPNDLLDRRDETIRQISELVGVRTLEQSDGQVNLMIGNGQSLVLGNQVRQLSLTGNINDPSKRDVVISGRPPQVMTGAIDSGQLGGLLNFRDGALDKAYNELGRVAVAMADSFNAVHQQGITLENRFGGNFFYDINDRELAGRRVLGSSGNAPPQDRQMYLYIDDSSQIQASSYDLTLEPGGMYRVTRLTDGAEVANGLLSGGFPMAINFDGLELVLEGGSFQAGDQYLLQSVTYGAKEFSSEIGNPKAIAFGSPIVTDAAIGNIGSGKMSPGHLLGPIGESPLFDLEGRMTPPLVVRFTSPTTYDILDNSDPGNPVHLQPPIRNQNFVPGANNVLFGSDRGATQVTSNGAMMGLPAGRLPLSQTSAEVVSQQLPNGYPSEILTITRASNTIGQAPVTQNVFTNVNASAREIASQLSTVAGVSANASTYVELSGLTLDTAAPPQISLNGQALLAHVELTPGVPQLASDVPDPALDPHGFNDYLAAQINGNADFQQQGIRAVAGSNAITGAPELRIYDKDGDNLQLALESSVGDSIAVSDGINPPVTLDGNGAGTASGIAVGGRLDVQLAEGLTLGSFPANSDLFGNTQAADFAQPAYLGIQAVLSGTPETGDTFTIDFNRDGASDNRNALALANMETAATINGISSYSRGYGTLVEEVGIQTSASKISRDAAGEVLNQTMQLRESVSGVNLDEEAANLIRFEQMFSANAQVISVARDLFDRLINSF